MHSLASDDFFDFHLNVGILLILDFPVIGKMIDNPFVNIPEWVFTFIVKVFKFYLSMFLFVDNVKLVQKLIINVTNDCP